MTCKSRICAEAKQQLAEENAAAWKLPGVKNDEWHHKVADNRLDLVREGEFFKIMGGL